MIPLIKWTMVYVVVHVLTILALKMKLTPLINKQKDPEMQKKYAPFMRKDLHLLNMFGGFPWWLTLWPRFIFH